MKLTYRMNAIEEELAMLTQLSGGKETPEDQRAYGRVQR